MDHGSSSCSSQTKRPSKTSKQIRQLNESVFELYKPQGPPSMQILFFHGFQHGDYKDAHLSTWKSGDDSCLWPQEWLAEEYPNAHIFSVSYDFCLKKTNNCGDVDMFIMGENLMANVLHAHIGQAPRCPVVLVGHSFGGLIMKQLCLQAKKKARSRHVKFLENLKGFFFYGTPHRGVPFEKLAAEFVTQKALLEYVTTLSKPTSRLNDDFEDIRDNNTWLIAGVGECLPIKLGFFRNCIVVPEASARYGEDFRVLSDANHLSICRPMTKISDSFTALTTLLDNISRSFNIEECQKNSLLGEKQIIKGISGEFFAGGETDKGISGEFFAGGETDKGISREFFAGGETDKGISGEFFAGGDTDKGISGEFFPGGDTDGRISGEFFAGGDTDKGISGEFFAGETQMEEYQDNFQHLPKHIFGIEPVLKEVKGKLSKATRLGLAGEGGLGKSTLAMALFNELIEERTYKYTCFIKDVKNIKDSVKKEVLQHIHCWEENVARKEEDGLEYLKGEVLLLVLDDVASEDKDLRIVSILQDDIHVHEDSRFIATSRDFKLLRRLDDVYRVRCLDIQSSKRLLLTYAFPEEVRGPPSLKGNANDIVKKCKGVPLTLEVIGKYLYQKPAPIWEQTLMALERADKGAQFDKKLWAKLKVSYDGLDEVEKDMFVYAATIFYNEDLSKVKKELWSIVTEGSQDMRWQHLRDLSLVWEVSGAHSGRAVTIGMHEQLLSLGRKIASTPEENRHMVWESKKALELLSGESDNSKDAIKDVVALKLDALESARDSNFSQYTKRVSIGATLCKMEKLKYLKMHYIDIDRIDAAIFPSTLVFLDLDHVKFSDPGAARERYSNSTWLGTSGNFAALEYFKFCDGDGLSDLLYSFGDLPTLKKMRIQSSDIRDVPFGNMQALEDLEFGAPVLPRSIGRLKRLKRLYIYDWGGLHELPETIGDLQALEDLGIVCCNNLSALPDSIGCLSRLKRLNISNCEGLRELPEIFGNLQALEDLGIVCCDNLSALPDSIDCLSKLRRLNISNCEGLLELPETIGNLQALEDLGIVCCNNLSALPDSIDCLSSLKRLNISNCEGLRDLPETFGMLQALEDLHISDCNYLSALPNSFGSLQRLKKLQIYGGKCLHDLPGTFLQLPGLELIDLRGTYLQSIPNLENLASLKTLQLSFDTQSGLPTLPECLVGVIPQRNIPPWHVHSLRVEKKQFLYGGTFEWFDMHGCRREGDGAWKVENTRSA